MFALSSRQWLALFVALGFGSAATAQAPVRGNVKPIGLSSGFAGQGLSNIYAQGIGTGYSVASLNALTLQSGMAYTPRINPPASIGGGGPTSAANKPFSGYSPTPTVSPYLNLFNESRGGNTDFNYQTLVRPQLQQLQFNQQSQRQTFEIGRRLEQISAQPDYNPEGSKSQYPTGHQTVFQYHGHYYPMPSARQRR